MWLGIVTLFPEMVQASAAVGVVGRAIDQGIVELEVINPRQFTRDRHQSVDDRPYGGGPGMVMMAQPLLDAVADARARYASRQEPIAAGSAGSTGTAGTRVPVAYLTPAGETLTQAKACELAELDGLILVAGRYEGVDERFSGAVDRLISIGDYVLSGGELPALVVLDAIARQLPGTLGNAASAIEESHLDGLLDYPQYTRPENAASGERVPAVLVSGDHQAIQRWRLQQALWRTWLNRPDLLANRPLSATERELLAEKLNDHSVAD